MFGGMIDGPAGDTDEATDGGVVDDGAASLLSHLQQLVLHAVPNAPEVDRIDTIVFIAGGIGRLHSQALYAGIVERHIKAAKSGHGLLDHRFHLGFISHIAAHGESFVPCAGQLLGSGTSRSFIDV